MNLFGHRRLVSAQVMVQNALGPGGAFLSSLQDLSAHARPTLVRRARERRGRGGCALCETTRSRWLALSAWVTNSFPPQVSPALQAAASALACSSWALIDLGSENCSALDPPHHSIATARRAHLRLAGRGHQQPLARRRQQGCETALLTLGGCGV